MDHEYIPKTTEQQEEILKRGNDHRGKAVEHILAFASCVAELKATCPKIERGSQFTQLCKEHWGLAPNPASDYAKLGGQIIKFYNLISYLPPSASTLFDMSGIPDDKLALGIQQGIINPSMKRHELESWKERGYKPFNEYQAEQERKRIREEEELKANASVAAEKQRAEEAIKQAEKKAAEAEASVKKTERAAKKREEELSDSYTKEYQKRTELEDKIRSFNMDKLNLETKIEELELELLKAKSKPRGQQEESKEDKKESVRINNRIHAAQAELNELLEKIRKAQAEFDSKADDDVAKARAEAEAAREEVERLKRQQQQEAPRRKSRRKDVLKALQVVADSMLTGELLDDEQDLLDLLNQL